MASSGVNSPVSVSVCFRMRSSASMVLTYSVPEVSSFAQGMKPASGSVSLTVFGMHLSLSNVALIGGTVTESSLWVSASSLMCKLSAGVGLGIVTTASVAGQSSTSYARISYDTHSLFETQTNLSIPTSGSKLLYLLGTNLGVFTTSSVAHLDSTRTIFIVGFRLSCCSQSFVWCLQILLLKS